MQRLPNKSQNGQSLLIVLLILAVSLTIGLSIISRSVSDLDISNQTDESVRAFSAAEAGVEDGLITGLSSEVITLANNASYQTTTENVGLGQTAYVFPAEYSTSQIQTFWMASYNLENETYTKTYDQSAITVYWGNQSTVDNPALTATVYYKDDGDAVTPYKTAKFALDPIVRNTVGSRCADSSNCFCQQPTSNYCALISSFNIGSYPLLEKVFKYRATLNLTNYSGVGKTLLLMRLRLLYSSESQIIGVSGVGIGTAFPSQGVKVVSVGQSGSTTRKIEVQRLNPTLPGILDFTLYSAGDLVHQ